MDTSSQHSDTCRPACLVLVYLDLDIYPQVFCLARLGLGIYQLVFYPMDLTLKVFDQVDISSVDLDIYPLAYSVQACLVLDTYQLASGRVA